jgi:transposase-like protein
MAKHVDSSTKETILLEIKNGTTVPEVCAKYGVGRNSVYRWLQTQADNTGTSSLEVAKLRRENQELKELIGAFALDKKRAEKNQRHF